MPFKSKAQQAAVMIAQKIARGTYREIMKKGPRSVHRILVNPRTGQVVLKPEGGTSFGTHEIMYNNLDKRLRTKSARFLATYVDASQGYDHTSTYALVGPHDSDGTRKPERDLLVRAHIALKAIIRKRGDRGM